MTSDAKIGLLLGLVFIIIIAFVINGLPNFFRQNASDEVSVRTAISSYNSLSVGISDQADEILKEINGPDIPLELPGENSVSQSDFAAVRFTQDFQEGAKVPLRQPGVVAKMPRVKKYVVQDGDNLAEIAKKVYGPVHGNKIAVIDKIFQANSNILESPDDILIGQKLIIPPLSTPKNEQARDKLVSSGMFKKVREIASKNLSALKNTVKKSAKSQYIVKDGDNLWQIAVKFFGDGSRWEDILKHNKGVISDADDIAVGMCLFLPGR